MEKTVHVNFDPLNTKTMSKIFKAWSARTSHLTPASKTNVNTDWVTGKVALVISKEDYDKAIVAHETSN